MFPVGARKQLVHADIQPERRPVPELEGSPSLSSSCHRRSDRGGTRDDNCTSDVRASFESGLVWELCTYSMMQMQHGARCWMLRLSNDCQFRPLGQLWKSRPVVTSTTVMHPLVSTGSCRLLRSRVHWGRQMQLLRRDIGIRCER